MASAIACRGMHRTVLLRASHDSACFACSTCAKVPLVRVFRERIKPRAVVSGEPITLPAIYVRVSTLYRISLPSTCVGVLILSRVTLRVHTV